MTRSVLNSIQVTATDLASMQDRFTKISNALTEVGLALETSVTGQMVIGTLTYPAVLAATTYYHQGFEIRKMVQAGLPTVYFRIDYQLYSRTTLNTEVVFVLRIHMGMAVSSTGVLSGYRMTSAMSNAINATPTTLSQPVVIASDGKNYLTMLISPNGIYASSAGFMCFGMERTRDRASGLYDAEGLMAMHGAIYASVIDSLTAGATSGSRVTVLNLLTGGNAVTANPYFASIGVGWGTTGSGTGDAASISPMPVGLPKLKGVSSLMFGYWRDEIVQAAEFNISIYGITVRLIALGANGVSMADTAVSAVMRVAMRCD